MTLEEIKKRYEALEPIKTRPMDDTWADKLIPFERFMENGPIVVELSKRFESEGPYQRMREINPELFDLVLEAFG